MMWFPRSLADWRAIDVRSSLQQSIFIPRPKWNVHDIPDLTGKVVIVTGGNTGIGKEMAKALLSHNAKVYLGCRSKEKAESAISDLEQVTGKKAVFLMLDLASLESIKTAANEFSSKEKELHILFNNAGVMFPPHSSLAEGYDLQWHTNVTGPFYFTKLLTPILLETVKNSPPKSVRVIHTSSVAHYIVRSQLLDFSTFKASPQRNKYGVQELYMQSKFGNVVVSNEMHRSYADQGLVSISLNPGNIDTDLYRHVDNLFTKLRKLALSSVSLGALTSLYAGTAEEAGEYGGEFLIPWARRGRARPETRDPQLGKELWTWLEEQVANI